MFGRVLGLREGLEQRMFLWLDHYSKPNIYPQDAPKITGRISDMLVDPAGVVLVILERFQVLGERDELYGMPILVRRDGETTFCIVPAKVMNDVLNANGANTATGDYV